VNWEDDLRLSTTACRGTGFRVVEAVINYMANDDEECSRPVEKGADLRNIASKASTASRTVHALDACFAFMAKVQNICGPASNLLIRR
jgi:hypothetical protein